MPGRRRVSGFDAVRGPDEDLLHGAGCGGVHVVLHLHGFEHHDKIALGDLLTFRHVDAGDDGLHRGGNDAGLGGVAVIALVLFAGMLQHAAAQRLGDALGIARPRRTGKIFDDIERNGECDATVVHFDDEAFGTPGIGRFGGCGTADRCRLTGFG